MFDNPIIFSLLISSIIALGFYIFNREKDKQNFDPNKNMKYVSSIWNCFYSMFTW